MNIQAERALHIIIELLATFIFLECLHFVQFVFQRARF